MRRSLLRCARLVSPLALLALGGCFPIGLVSQGVALLDHPSVGANPASTGSGGASFSGQAFGLFGHPFSSASATPTSGTPASANAGSSNTAGAAPTNANTATSNPTSTDSSDPSIVSRMFGLFGHAWPTASATASTANTADAYTTGANTAGANPTSTDRGSAGAASQASGLFGHLSPASSTDTATTNPTNTGSGSPGIISRMFGFFGHPFPAAGTNATSTPTANQASTSSGAGAGSKTFGQSDHSSLTASTNTATTNPTSADGASPSSASPSSVGLARGQSDHPSPIASADTANPNPTSASGDSVSPALRQSNPTASTASVTAANANPTSTDSDSTNIFSRIFGLFRHRTPTTNANIAGENPANADAGPGTASFGIVLAMRFVAATGQSVAGMNGAVSAMTPAHGVGTASSFRVAGIGNAGMGMVPQTDMDDASMAGTPGPLRPAPGQVTEFKIRMEDGSTLTLVQADDEGLLPGDRVQITSGGHMHVTRAD